MCGILGLGINILFNMQFRLVSNNNRGKKSVSLTFSKQWNGSSVSLHPQSSERGNDSSSSGILPVPLYKIHNV